jgi:hypothetical protein
MDMIADATADTVMATAIGDNRPSRISNKNKMLGRFGG